MSKQVHDLQAALENKRAAITTKEAEIDGYKKSFAETAKAVAPERSLFPEFKFDKDGLPEELRTALESIGAGATA
eukprot:5368303-Pyramimonas_sp.AAC.1